MADQPITTSIDSLVKYLKEHGETDTTTLSRILNVNEGTVVDWSDILEKSGMVKITYKVGKMFLSPASGALTGGQPLVEKAVVDVKERVIENEIQSQEELLNNIRSRIELYSRTVKNVEAVFQEKGGEAKKALDRINVMEKEASRYSNSIVSKHDSVTKIINTLDSEIKNLETDADQIRKFNLDTSGAKGVIDDINSKITVFNSNVKQMDNEFSRMVNEQRNQLKAIEASVKVEIDVIKDSASAESRKIAEYDSMLKSYKKRADASSTTISKERTRMLDEAIKTRDEVLGIYSTATTQLNLLNESLKSMKDSWGLLAVFNDKLTKIKADLDLCMKEVNELQSGIEGTSRELKSPKGKGSDMNKAESNFKSSRAKLSELQKKSDKLAKDMQDLAK